MLVEIKKDLSLTPGESVLLDMHSFLNVINIISGELQILEMLSKRPEAMNDCVNLCFQIKDGLTDPEKILACARDIESHIDYISRKTQALIHESPHLEQEPDAVEAMENINSILEILRIRALEILARYDAPEAWQDHDVQVLSQNFIDVFKAIEKNSKGKYRFAYNPAVWEPGAYLIMLVIQGNDQGQILMPPVFQDVMRDLMANARKYTGPGGKILAGAVNDGHFLRFAVEDTGMGIPEDEIEQVVDFGFRASNAGGKRTMGGGFGLTKAYQVTTGFNGRMWIDSAPEKGTRVSISIPVPE
ncbi:MAG: sensor histidine kinase [Desulfonatronovibrionaceae bacterium]